MGRRHQKAWVIGAFILLSLAGDRVFVGEIARGPDLAFSLREFIPGGPILPLRYVSQQEATQASLFALSNHSPAGLSTDSLPQAAAAPASLSAAARPHAERQAVLSGEGRSLVEIRSPFVERALISEEDTRPAVHVLSRSRFGTGNSAGESAEETTIPLAILVAGLGEDPWGNSLSMAEDNPFTHVLQQEGSHTGAPTTIAADSHTTTPAADPTTPPTNQGVTPPTGDTGNPSVDPEPGNDGSDSGTGSPSGETRPEVVLFLSSATGGVAALRADYEGGRIFRLDQSRVMEIDYISFSGTRDYSDYFIYNDFNADGLGDLLRTSKSSGTYQLFLNTGTSWTALPSARLPFRPACGTWLAMLSRTSNQLAFYDADGHLLEVMQALGDGTFASLLSFPLPADYDGVVGVDFTLDGYDDLVLQNLNLNRVNYLTNAAGDGFQPLSASAPTFPAPVMGRFQPRPNQSKTKFWLCQYGDQNLVYMVNRYNRAVPVLLFNDLGVETCLILADFDQNGTVDTGVGHIVR